LCFAASLLTSACSDDTSSSTPSPPAATAAAGSGSTASGSRDTPATEAPSAGGTTAGESPAAGLDGAPLDPGDSSASGGTPASAGAGVSGAPATGGTPASAFPGDVTRPRIMIVGDSISAGPGCYKKYLLADLNAAGIVSFDFVGEYTDDCGGGVMHSARSCTTAADYIQPTFTLRADCGGGTFPGLATLMATHDPDLLMLQLGVNDVWNGQATEAILANYSTLLEQARAENPSVVVAVARIQQIRPTADGDAVFARAQQLVDAVPTWASRVSQDGSPVFVADLWTNSDTAQTLDGVHPDDAGAQRMGQNWFEALRTILPSN
jgi:hypothetical protein